MKMLCAFLLAYLSLFYCNHAYSQNDEAIADSIIEKLNWYSKQQASPTIFVHFDKNIYTENEQAWFTAYLLKTGVDVEEYHTLSVALIRHLDRSILSSEKFMMGQGLAFGNIFLPDSLPAGDYSFIAYTNRLKNNHPEDVFVQPITIKSGKDPSFIATLKFADSINANTDTARLVIRAYTPGIKLLKGIPVNYTIGDTLSPLLKGTIRTDAFGEAKLSIPLKKITTANNLLHTSIKNGNDEKVFRLRLPVYKKEIGIKFYPEGGHLVEGIHNVVGWEVKNSAAEPLVVSGVLIENNVAIDTIETNAYGMGRFSLTPANNSRYYIKLLFNHDQDSVFQLPAPLPKGTVATIENAVCNDTLFVTLTDHERADYLLLVHNYEHTFITTSIGSADRPLRLKIPLDEVPKGVATFTLLDNKGRPLIERLFFAHYNKRVEVNIATDKKEYQAREKVSFKIRLNNQGFKQSAGFFSIACVQDNRIEARKMTDIVSYGYIKHQLTELPFKKTILDYTEEDKSYLEDVLLIRGWRRYTWQDAMNRTSSDTVVQRSSLAYKGSITYSAKPLKNPVQLGVFNNKSFDLLTTDSSGKFQLSTSQLYVANEAKVNLFINKKNKDNYNIRMNDPYNEMNVRLAKAFDLKNYDPPLVEQSSQMVLIKQDERAKQLLDVKVTAKKDNSFFAGTKNECGDYVCPYNILNCPNHPFGYAVPVKGNYYMEHGARVKYLGCGNSDAEERFLISFSGINMHKEFYAPDYSKFSPPEPEYISTIFWKHSIVTNSKGEADLSFYTSDISGRFRIIIQGVTREACFYGEHLFEVTKSN